MNIIKPTFFLGTFGGALLFCGVLVLRPVWVADSVLSDLRHMRGRSFSVEQLRRWADRHGGTVECMTGRCEASVRVANRLLSAFRLSPPLEFYAFVDVTPNGQLTSATLTLTARPRGAVTLVVINYSASREPNSEARAAHVAKGPAEKPGVVYVVSSKFGAADLALAYEINTWCLARIGGCAADRQAPRIWALESTPVTKRR